MYKTLLSIFLCYASTITAACVGYGFCETDLGPHSAYLGASMGDSKELCYHCGLHVDAKTTLLIPHTTHELNSIAFENGALPRNNTIISQNVEKGEVGHSALSGCTAELSLKRPKIER